MVPAKAIRQHSRRSCASANIVEAAAPKGTPSPSLVRLAGVPRPPLDLVRSHVRVQLTAQEDTSARWVGPIDPPPTKLTVRTWAKLPQPGPEPLEVGRGPTFLDGLGNLLD
jgi:hypothetical protein